MYPIIIHGNKLNDMIKVYTMEGCPYCDELKKKLTEMKVEYTEVNTDLPENEAEYEYIAEIADSSMVPLVVVGKNLLVPEKSFNTIEEAASITKKLMNG